MKKAGKLLPFLLVLTIVFSLSVTALAAGETYTITVLGSSTTADHTFEAYQIFAGDLYDPNIEKNEADTLQNKVLSNIVWGKGVDQEKAVNGKTLSQAFDGKTAAEIAEELSNGNSVSEAQAFAKKVAPYLSTTCTTSTKDEASGNYLISGLEAGYYLVKDKDSSLEDGKTDDFYTAYMMKVVADVTATPKGEKPTLRKQIQNNGTGEWSTTGNAAFQLGGTVHFRLLATVPDIGRYPNGYTYKITDSMTIGLTSNVSKASDVQIEINNDSSKTLSDSYYSVVSSKYDVKEGQADRFVLTVDVTKAIAEGALRAGDELYINYTAVLNDLADFYLIGPYPNTNTAYLEYSNNPNGEGTGKTPDSTVNAWTFAAIASKTDKATGAALTGAKFVLSREANLKVSDMQCDEEGNPTVTTGLIPLHTGGRAAYELATKEEIDAGGTDITYVAELGTNVVLAGFGEHTYYLYETKAPNGYNLLAEPVKVTFHTTPTMNSRTDPAYITLNDSETRNTTMMFTVENSSGATLPETGGIGTTLFYVIGGLLVVGAGVLLVTKKRMGKADN